MQSPTDETGPILDWLWIYLVVVNVGVFSLMGFDKLSAKMRTERVPEFWFVLCSLAGGVGGIILGMFVFHQFRVFFEIVPGFSPC